MEKSLSVVISALDCHNNEMHSEMPLVLHSVCGGSMLSFAVKAAERLVRPVVITADGSGSIGEHLNESCRIHPLPDESISAYTYLQTIAEIGAATEYLILLPGNLPLVTTSTLQQMADFAGSRRLNLAALGTKPDEPSHAQNTVFCIRSEWLLESLKLYREQLKQTLSYELDLWNLSSEKAGKDIFIPEDPKESFFVTDRITLAEAGSIMRKRINYGHMRSGVTIIDPAQTYIGPEVKIGQDTIIYPGNVLEGNTVIGKGCTLYPNNRLNHARVGDRVILQSSVILESSIGDETTVGPYAYIRPGSEIGRKARIGDFVEIKKSIIGDGTKVSHLTYIGDAQLGKGINVGCGVVFVNYDGISKHRVVVGDHAFIGCNVNLIAPVEVEDHAYIAAGSTITDKVPARALAIARARQLNKEGWVDRRARKQAEAQSKSEDNK